MKKMTGITILMMIAMAMLYAEEEPAGEMMVCMDNAEYRVTLYGEHFDVEYPIGITEEMIWDAAEAVRRTDPAAYEDVWFVVKNREHTVSSMYPAGSGPENGEDVGKLVESVFSHLREVSSIPIAVGETD